MIQIQLMSRRLPYCDTKRSVFFRNLTHGLFLENGKRDKWKTAYSYWIGYFFGELNIRFNKRPN